MTLATAEGTTVIFSFHVARIRDKANATEETRDDATSKMRMFVKEAFQRELILLKKRSSAVVLTPILAALEK